MRQILLRVKFVLQALGFTALVVIQGFLINQPRASANAPYLASDVLGQSDSEGNVSFTQSAADNGDGNQSDATGLEQPRGSLIDAVSHRLFIVDGLNCRILVYLLDSHNNLIDRVADYALGQSSVGPTTCSSTSQNTLNTYYAGLAYDPERSRLFVSSYNDNRVVMFDLSGGISSGMNATYVLGQPDFETTDMNTSQDGMNNPAGLAYDSDTDLLYVSEYNNSRITVYSVAPGIISSGMNATYVLGQPDFDSSNSGCSSTSFDYQWGIALDSKQERLFVGDGDSSSNARIMIFDVHSITNGEAAVHVLGQPDFDSCSAPYSNPTQQNVLYPYNALAYDTDNQVLFVDHADGFRRMTLFDVSEITNGEAAIAVIGQPDFVSEDDLGTTAYSIHGDYQGNMAYDLENNRLYYPDGYTSHRILIFNFVKLPSALHSSSATLSTAYSSSLATTQHQGTVSYSVSSGSLPPGLSLSTSTGLISGTPTTVGTYSFSVTAIDDNGAIGYFKDSKSYVLGVSAASSPASNPGSTTTTTTTKKTTTSSTDEEVVPEEVVALTDTTTDTPSQDSNTVPAPKPSNLAPSTSNLSIVWWGMGGVSFLLILIVLGLVAKRSD